MKTVGSIKPTGTCTIKTIQREKLANSLFLIIKEERAEEVFD